MEATKRQRRLAAQRAFKKPVTVFEQIDLSKPKKTITYPLEKNGKKK